MTSQPHGPTTIPARLTVEELSGAIGRPINEVQAVLDAREEPSAPGEVIGPDLAVEVARALGSTVKIETRDLALEALYEMEIRGEAGVAVMTPRAESLVRGVEANKEALDREIEAASEHWSVARMPMIDRTILRLGLYELLNETDTPVAVIVSEAVRLAKTYSTERSGSFVNGVLASLARSERP